MKFLENLRIRSKLLFLYSALFICAISLSGGILYHIAGKSIEDQNEMELMNSTRSILNMVRTVARTSVKIHLKSIVMQNRRLVEYWYSLFHSGQLSEAEAKKMAGRSLLQMRIGTTGYIFVWDVREAPRRIPLAVHPVIQGSDVAYVDFVQKGAAMKNGYMEYEWANPGDTEKRKKSMYLSYFKPWEWVIAASSYKEEFLELVGADDFRDSILPMHFGRSGYSYVLDTRGNIIIHPMLSGNYYEARDTEGLYFVREMIKKKRGTIYYTWQNPGEPAPRKKMAVYDYIPENNWIVVSSSYQDEFKKPLMQLRAVIIITIAASFVLVLSLSFWIGSGIASPIHSLIERLSLGAKGDFTIRMNHETRDEIGELSSYFNSFMERLEHYEHDLKKEIRVRESTGDELKAVNLELVKTHEELALSNENLSAEKERLMITLRSIGDGVIATDRDGIVIMANPEAERMIDLGREGLVGSPVEEIVRLADENSGTPLPNPASSVIE
ncbi:MAG: HAMP domain-containing protein [Chrysiogenales bacterium]|nr:MAG: HAMP domain-containing protein [Chrysiogenales bacterium]